MSMNYRSAKKRGMVKSSKKLTTLGASMDQGVGAKGYTNFKTLAGDMAQGDRPRKFKPTKLGEGMNQ